MTEKTLAEKLILIEKVRSRFQKEIRTILPDFPCIVEIGFHRLPNNLPLFLVASRNNRWRTNIGTSIAWASSSLGAGATNVYTEIHDIIEMEIDNL